MITFMMIMLLLQIACSQNPAELLEEANQLYESGDAAQAAQLYNEILSRQGNPAPTKDQLFECEFKLVLCKIMQNASSIESEIRKLHDHHVNNLDPVHYKVILEAILEALIDEKKIEAFLETLGLINDRYGDNQKVKEMMMEQIKRFMESQKDSEFRSKFRELAGSVGSYL